jgi:hypothetical protein
MKFKGRAVNKYNDIFGKIVIFVCIANFNQTIKDPNLTSRLGLRT